MDENIEIKKTDFNCEAVITVLQLFIDISEFDSTGRISHIFVDKDILHMKLKDFSVWLKTDKLGDDLRNEVCRFIAGCYLSKPLLDANT